KIGDQRAWPWITTGHLHDPQDEVATTAWRAAVVLVPDDKTHWLAEQLVARLGDGSYETKRSLSRALIQLGQTVEPLLAEAMTSPDEHVQAHAEATWHLYRDPESTFMPPTA